VPTAQTTAEDTPLTITGLSIADTDAASGSMTVTLSVAQGTLVVTGGAATITGSGTTTVTLTGTITDINATLSASNAVTYTPSLNYNGSDTLSMTTSDGGNTGSGGPLSDTDTVAITVTAVNDAPTLSLPTAQSTNEDTALFVTGISIADVDAGTGNMTVTLAVAHGIVTLDAAAASSVGVTITTNSTASVQLSGSVMGINMLLATSNSVRYTPTNHFNGSDALSITVSDGGNTGSGGTKSGSASVA
jgi:hypothetical protein